MEDLKYLKRKAHPLKAQLGINTLILLSTCVKLTVPKYLSQAIQEFNLKTYGHYVQPTETFFSIFIINYIYIISDNEFAQLGVVFCALQQHTCSWPGKVDD